MVSVPSVVKKGLIEVSSIYGFHQSFIMRILVLEPYFGGSHRRFLEDLEKTLPFSFHFLTLPARKWKWRMRFSAPWYAEKLASLSPDYDALLCSTFVDVATLKGIGPEWLHHIPIYTYFHENQFAYPVQVEDERDFHFALTNLTTAISSDKLAFNSHYNLETFLSGCQKIIKKVPDMKLDAVSSIRNKSIVLHPGMDFSNLDLIKRAEIEENDPIIVWNHRWEHDKNPEFFFETLFALDEEDIAFKVIVLGQSFERQPSIFNIARQRLAHRLLYFGYAEDIDKYYELLGQGAMVISTSIHEFYGMSVIEAVRAGCRPLLPRRLSYPELFPDEYLYDDADFAKRVKQDLKFGALDNQTARKLTQGYSWDNLSLSYEQWISAPSS